MNRSPHTQERAQPVEYEFRSLLDDPVAHTIDRFELEVAEQIGVTAQQRRSDHWVIIPCSQRTGTSTRVWAYSPRSQRHISRVWNVRNQRDPATA